MPEDETSIDTRGAAAFENTHWTRVLIAASQNAPGAGDALEVLCGKYWSPIYAFLRRQGQSAEDAKDLTQGFFAHLLRNSRLPAVDPARGKFRSFLLACLNNYVRNELDKQKAEKRGAGRPTVPIGAVVSGETAGFEPRASDDPASAFERQWATTLVSDVLARLREQCVRDGKGELFDRMTEFLTDRAERGDYGAVASKLNMTEGAVRTAVSRLRSQFRELLLREVRLTVEDPGEVEAEIQHLLRVFTPPGP